MDLLQRLCMLLTLFCVGIFPFVPTAYSADQFIINRSASEHDDRYQYTHDLLALIIEATNTDFGEASLLVSDVNMSRNRILRSLIDAKTINIIAEASKLEWNQKLIPIKIPIRKGIQGFRVFIIKKKNVSIVANIKTLAQLMALKTGSGSQWSTKVAMQKAGFDVVESMQYESLFKMLSMERFVTFGRGVNEVYQEIALFTDYYPDLVADENIMLHIPLVTYYYVSPKKPQLANRIKIGLQRIIENGQFDQIFYQRHCEFLINSNMNNRLIFDIDNPLLSESELTSMLEKDFLLNPHDDFFTLCKAYY